MALLENELDTRLFIRDGHSIKLTEPGKILYDQSLISLGHVEKALTGIREWKGLERGTLRIGSTLTSSGYILPPVLKSFHEECPHIDLKLTRILSDEAPSSLRRGDIDVAIGILPKKEMPGFHVVELMERRDMIISREKLRFLEDDPLMEKLLSPKPLIVAGPGMHSRNRMDRIFDRWSASPRIVLECDDVEVIKKMVISGLGVSLLPEIAVSGEIKREELYGLPLENEGAANIIGLLTLPESLEIPSLRIFADIIGKLLPAS